MEPGERIEEVVDDLRFLEPIEAAIGGVGAVPGLELPSAGRRIRVESLTAEFQERGRSVRGERRRYPELAGKQPGQLQVVPEGPITLRACAIAWAPPTTILSAASTPNSGTPTNSASEARHIHRSSLR